MMHIHVSEVAEVIKLNKIDNQPWGFRVTGGLDFGTPLAVIKVTAGSLAEQAGLKVGDMLLQANGKCLSFLTHHDAYQFLQEAGNFIELSVVRGSLVVPPPLASPESLAAEKINENETDKEVENHNEDAVKAPPPPQKPTLFETIFGPMDEPPTERCKSAFEELVEELSQKQGSVTDVLADTTQVQHPETTENAASECAVQESTQPEPPTNTATTENIVSATTNATAAAVVTAAVAAASAAESVAKVAAAAATTETSEPPVSETEVSNQAVEQEQQILEDSTKKEVTEEELQEIMLGHAEVVKGKAIGVDFEKMKLTNVDFIEQSKVIKALKEDETEPEKKKLSTFLIAPDRPKIKPKEKPKKPKESPKQTETKTETTISQENTGVTESQPVNQEATEISDSEQPTSTEQQDVTSTKDLVDNETPSKEQQGENETHEGQEKGEDTNAEVKQEIAEPETAKESDELTAIKNQLSALLQLPAAMQKQLSLIQEEINNIVQKKINEQLGETTEDETTEALQEEGVSEAQEQSHENETEGEKIVQEGEKGEQTNEQEEDSRAQKAQEGKGEHNEQAGEEPTNVTDVQEPATESQTQEGEAPESTEEQPTEERKRDIKWQHETPKKNKPFFPLTPLPRGIVLPGRKKRFQVNPEEVYNDEFIAETLSGNAEVIIGTTIGINFMKYTPHRSYDHLKTSSVYRMIHEAESTGSASFGGRQEKLVAAEDYQTKEEPENKV